MPREGDVFRLPRTSMFTRAAGICLLSECAPYKHHRPPTPATSPTYSATLLSLSLFSFELPSFILPCAPCSSSGLAQVSPRFRSRNRFQQAYLRNIEKFSGEEIVDSFRGGRELGRFLKCVFCFYFMRQKVAIWIKMTEFNSEI